MKATANPDLGDTQILHLLPRWVTSAPGQGPDSVALSSSAALALRDGVFRSPGGPLPGSFTVGSVGFGGGKFSLSMREHRGAGHLFFSIHVLFRTCFPPSRLKYWQTLSMKTGISSRK